MAVGGVRSRSKALAAAAAVVLLHLARPSLAGAPYSPGNSFQAQPFTGQGGLPAEPVEVRVSALLQQLLSVDDRNYLFESVVLVVLQWDDPLAEQGVIDSTNSFRNGTKQDCDRPCSSDFTLSKSENQEINRFNSCCDGIWLPTVRMINVRALPDTRLQPYEISVNGTTVSWGVTINSEVYSAMNVRHFPFDEQKLVLQFGK